MNLHHHRLFHCLLVALQTTNAVVRRRKRWGDAFAVNSHSSKRRLALSALSIQSNAHSLDDFFKDGILLDGPHMMRTKLPPEKQKKTKNEKTNKQINKKKKKKKKKKK